MAWEVVSVERKTFNNNNNSQRKQRIAEDIATVDFRCTSENCGVEKRFSKKFTAATYFDDGSIKEINVTTAIGNYFKID